jgi:hypothetical protein
MQDLSLTLDEPIHQVLKLSKYFVQLGFARFIPPIHHETVFIVCKSTLTDKSHKVYAAFANYFGNETVSPDFVNSDTVIRSELLSQNLLFIILAAFDGSIFFDVVKKFPSSLQPFGVDIVLWLLRWHLIEHDPINAASPIIIQ